MSADKENDQNRADELWRLFLTKGDHDPSLNAPWYTSTRLRPLIRRLPSDPRCKMCYYPFSGLGGRLSKHLLGIGQSNMNPNLCNICEEFGRKYPGGAEVELSILFADVRGSTTLAEKMTPSEFSRLISRFFNATTRALYDQGALIEKLIGDGITAFFTPGFSGLSHAQHAVQAARDIIKATAPRSASEPPLPVGIGVHTGVAYVGSITSESGSSSIAVLGDTANIGARLASLALAGEIFISQSTAKAAGLEPAGYEIRQVSLKGRSEPVEVWVLRN